MSEDFEQPPVSAWSTPPALLPPGAVYTTQDFSLLSQAELPVGRLPNPEPGPFIIQGRPTANGQPGARLKHDSRCATCGKGFVKGDVVRAQLAMNWDEAVFSHNHCDMPPPPIDPSKFRYHGIGMKAESPSPSKLAALRALES